MYRQNAGLPDYRGNDGLHGESQSLCSVTSPASVCLTCVLYCEAVIYHLLSL